MSESFYDHLKIEYGVCPPDCSACEETCLERRDGDLVGTGVIKAIHAEEVHFHGAATCIQCSQPACGEVCPTGAIHKSRTDGTVGIAREKCIGCGLCTLACPYGGIYYDSNKEKATKCDLCEGEPECVKACNYRVLSFLKSRPIYNYLHEDLLSPGASLCAGCPAELALRFIMRVLGKDAVYFAAPGCAAVLQSGTGIKTTSLTYAATVMCLMTNVPSTMTGVKRYYRKKGKDVTCVAFVGDGATADVGFQPLSGAAERGENIIYICYDNEGYMNTGIQRSSTTPLRGWTTTTPTEKNRRGKEQPSKYIPLVMAFHGIRYVATATVGYLEDFAQKLVKAKAIKDGMTYIHLLSPCPTGWRFDSSDAIEVSKWAVETNYFPLWEAESGKFRLTHQVEKPQPIREFTKLMGRFSHLREEDLEDIQKAVDSRFTMIQKLTEIS
jgi:phenylglyoxylate dehydrogenase beta subunit